MVTRVSARVVGGLRRLFNGTAHIATRELSWLGGTRMDVMRIRHSVLQAEAPRGPMELLRAVVLLALNNNEVVPEGSHAALDPPPLPSYGAPLCAPKTEFMGGIESLVRVTVLAECLHQLRGFVTDHLLGSADWVLYENPDALDVLHQVV